MRKAKFPHGHLSSSAQHTKGYINVLVLSELRTEEGYKHCMIKKNPNNPQLGLKNHSIEFTIVFSMFSTSQQPTKTALYYTDSNLLDSSWESLHA